MWFDYFGDKCLIALTETVVSANTTYVTVKPTAPQSAVTESSVPTLDLLHSQMLPELFVMPKIELLWPDFSNKIPLKIHLKFIHPLSVTAYPMQSILWGLGWGWQLL